MAIKELKEKIKENPNKVMNIEEIKWIQTVPTEYLELLNENLDVKEVLEGKYPLTYQAKKFLKELYKQYSDDFVEEVKKFIDFASKRLPNFAFDYTIKTEKKGVVIIWFTYIYNNHFVRKSILYHTSNNKIDCNWLFERIINTAETYNKKYLMN